MHAKLKLWIVESRSPPMALREINAACVKQPRKLSGGRQYVHKATARRQRSVQTPERLPPRAGSLASRRRRARRFNSPPAPALAPPARVIAMQPRLATRVGAHLLCVRSGVAS